MKSIRLHQREVRAVLDGRQTQLRRIVKNPNPRFSVYAYNEGEPYPYYFRRKDAVWDSFKTIDALAAKHCPFGKPSDQLWAKETWTQDSRGGTEANGQDAVYYRADMPDDVWAGHWKPSIHMPRWASRITLEVETVRVERVQDISEEDAKAEGVAPDDYPYGGSTLTPYWQGFRQVWRQINGVESWDRNDWVWVLNFRRIS